MTVEPPIQPGGRFGDLIVQDELGRGAFATVYRARDLLLERAVALKVLHARGSHASADAARRMLREARLVSRLSSPHVVTLYCVHTLDDGGLAFELELVEGGSLEDRLQHTPRPAPAETRHIVLGVARALAAAHERGVLHRDVKPGNVLLGPDGVVKLTDFGLGRLLDEGAVSSHSGGQIAGTPSYMAPEVMTGAPPTPAADLFSVGVLLYRMLTGRLPFEGRSLAQLFVALSECAPPPLPADAPADLAAAALLCLSKDPASRPASAAALVALLEGQAEAPAPPKHAPQSPASAHRRLVGRALELQQLEAALAEAEEGRPASIALSGEVGLGSSELIQALGERARARGFVWLDVALTPAGGLRQPFLACLRRALRVEDRASASHILTEERFGAAAQTLRDVLVNEEPPDPRDHERQAWALEQLLGRMLGEGPVLLTLDNLPWADADDLRLLTSVTRLVGEKPLVTLCALGARGLEAGGQPSPDLLRLGQELARRPGALALELMPLSDDAVFQLLQEQCAPATLEAATGQALVEKAGGNPLHALELLRHLRAVGDLALQSGRWVRQTSAASTALPRSLTDLLLLRLAALDEDERSLLDVAAVDGIQFEGQSVAEALGQPLLRVLQGLQRLHRKHGLVQPSSEGYRFAHALHRDVLYADLAMDLRRELHRTLAEQLERRAETATLDPARLGLHWESAGEPARARPYLLRAAQASLSRQENVRAVDLATRAGFTPALGATDDEVRAQPDLVIGLAGACYDLGRRPEAAAWAARLRAAARTAGDALLEQRAVVLQNDLGYWERGARGVDPAALARAAEVLPVGRDRALACFYLAHEAQAGRGDQEAAERWLAEADSIAGQMGLQRLHAMFTDFAGTLALARGRAAEAEERYLEAAALCRTLGRRTDAAISEVNAALSRFARGELSGLTTPLEEAARTFERAGFAVRAAHVGVHLARILYAQGDPEAALEQLAKVLRALAVEPSPQAQGYALMQQTYLLAVRGALPEAAASLAELSALAERTGLLTAAVRGAGLASLQHGLLGRAEAAAADASTAVRLAAGGSDARVRSEAALHLAEQALLVGAPVPLEALAGLLPASPAPDDVLSQRAARLIEAARADADPSADPAPLQRAAQHIEEAPWVDRRAETRVLALLLSARASVRRGAAARADEQAALGLDAARRLGLVWHELALLRVARQADAPAEQRARRAELLESLAARLPDDDARTRLARQWA